MSATPASLRSVEVGGNRHCHGHRRGGGTRIIVAPHGDRWERRLSGLPERRRSPLTLCLGLGRIGVERALGKLPFVAAGLAPTPGALDAPPAAALVAHHLDSFAGRVVAVIGVFFLNAINLGCQPSSCSSCCCYCCFCCCCCG